MSGIPDCRHPPALTSSRPRPPWPNSCAIASRNGNLPAPLLPELPLVIGNWPKIKLRPTLATRPCKNCGRSTSRNGIRHCAKSGRANGKGGLAPRTIGHAHRVLSKALSDAVENEVIAKNVATTKVAPKVPDDEMAIVQDVPAFIDNRLYVPAMASLFTGMRLGEVLAVGSMWT